MKKGINSRSKPPSRQANKTYLLICEGERTESNYFKALRRDLRLPSVTIEVVGCGSQDNIPAKLSECLKDGKFNKIFCIFDKESHLPQDTQRFEKTLRAIQKEGITPIVSVPSFEIWVLCHFEALSFSFKDADDVITYLKKKHLPHYDKSDKNLYNKLKNNTKNACTHAQKTWKGKDYPNPSTAVYEVLQEFLPPSNT